MLNSFNEVIKQPLISWSEPTTQQTEEAPF
jgi:hypothetical protein